MLARQRAGFTLVELLVVIGIIAVLLGLLLPAIQRVRGSAAALQCSVRLRDLGTALHAYHADRQKLPMGNSPNVPGEAMPFTGWHVRILPYVEQEPLYRATRASFQANPNFLVTPPHEPRATIIPLFLCPLEERQQHLPSPLSGLTTYLGVSGINQHTRDGLLFHGGQVRFSEIGDGLSQTLLVGERPPPPRCNLGWWYAGWGMNQNGAGEMILGVNEVNTFAPGTIGATCPPGPYEFRRTDVFDEQGSFHFWSLHPGGGHFLFADRSVRFLRYSAASVLPALATRNGKELPVSLE